MSGVIDSIERAQLRRVPSFQAGDRVRVHFQVVEGTRRRTQVFEGIVIKRQGNGARETFTVRKQSFGVGVERTFPVHSPKIERISSVIVASRAHRTWSWRYSLPLPATATITSSGESTSGSASLSIGSLTRTMVS